MNIPTTDAAKRLATLMNRRLTTPWSDKEIRRYKQLVKSACFKSFDDLALIERYYAFERRKGDKGFHRRDLFTLLNNYPSELDRARAWESRNRPLVRPRYQSTNGARPATDAEFQRIGDLARKQLEEFRDRLRNPKSQPTA